ncbi:MAG TPA: NYN domain-containing protein [Candidatus Anoxymicrobiaceae bacterium]|jgi:predicted RNA-binding protein with PIN domain
MPDRLIVDGYNLMYADEELKSLMREDLQVARDMLLALIEDYCAREEHRALVVFDAGGRPGPATTENRSAFLEVAYTAAGQTADAYIEKLAYGLPGEESHLTMLVTGDYDQQKVASGAGLLRVSSREFLIDMRGSRKLADEATSRGRKSRKRVPLEERLPEDVRSALDRFREPR